MEINTPFSPLYSLLKYVSGGLASRFSSLLGLVYVSGEAGVTLRVFMARLQRRTLASLEIVQRTVFLKVLDGHCRITNKRQQTTFE